jgi:hypothetical protein
MSHDRKKQLRQTKRTLKNAGNRRRRRELKRDLEENPDDPMMEYDLDRFRSDGLNGVDRDSTRRKKEKHKPEDDKGLRADESPP